MENNSIVMPQQIVENNMKAAKTKADLPFGKLFILGIMAGMFIACGATTSSLAMHGIANVGVARLVAGVIFPVGLMMILLVGGELFTGDCMMIMGVIDRRIKVLDMLRVLFVVYVSNFVGGCLIAYLTFASGQYNYTGGLLGAFTVKVAMGKVSMSFWSAFCSGILCNIFVCMAVLMAAAAKSVVGKVWAAFFPIMAFVVGGFEHCVANMYYIPAGILAKTNDGYVQKAMEEYGYTAQQLDNLNWGNFLYKSALPVTLGNIVGGMVFVGVLLVLVHHSKIKADAAK